MPQYGLGNFIYEVAVNSGAANFQFHDRDDATNTAEVTVDAKDFPEGISQPDSREVAEVAFAQVSKKLNDKRDERLKQEAADALERKTTEDARQREAAVAVHANSEDVATQPAKVEKDGTRVFNTETATDGKPSEEKKS